MGTLKKYRVLLAIILIAAAGSFYFFYHMYTDDMAALEDFQTAYQKFDLAMTEFSAPVFGAPIKGAPPTDNLEQLAGTAYVELRTRASMQISSLIKNEKQVMSTSLQIADLAGKELEALKTYQKAAIPQAANLPALAKAYHDLTAERQSAYAHFQALGAQ